MNHKIIVLLTTCNGVGWVDEQLNSILGQMGVDVRVFVSDDFSDDDTKTKLEQAANSEPRLLLLSTISKYGSAGKNFYRLIQDVDLDNCDYIAFSDQDDIWEVDKLIRHVELMRQHQADGVSSNVMAFWPNGKEKLLVKSQSQKELDYLFESAGPGCTFLMTPWLVNKVREQLLDANSPAKDVALHDWLTYAVCRANGRHWVIDEQPSVRYRQHGNNVVGANVGVRAAWVRLLKIKRHWYRNEVLKVAEVSQKILNDSKVDELVQLLRSNSFFARFKLLKFVPQARRSTVDRMALAFAIVVGLF